MEQEIRGFLMSRRARITPRQAGLPYVGGTRRVPGLRREEVAMLAGVSVEYYTRLERGRLGGASESVLKSIAQALQLNEEEYAYLRTLAKDVSPSHRVQNGRSRRMSPINASARQVLDSMSVPAIVQNERLDFLAANRMGRALYTDLTSDVHAAGPSNFARYAFLDSRAESFFMDLGTSRDLLVAALRSAAGRDPLDGELTELIGELSACSQDFAERWAKRNVQRHLHGHKRFNHPAVGELDLEFNDFAFPGAPDVSIVTYTAQPQSPTADALSILDTWATTREEDATAAHRDAEIQAS